MEPYRAVTKCDLIPLPALLTETSILYTDGHTDRQADSSITLNTFVLQGYKKSFLLKKQHCVI